MNRSFIHFLLIFCLLLAQPVQGLTKAAGGSVCHDASGNEVSQIQAATAHTAAMPEQAMHEHENEHENEHEHEHQHDGKPHPHQPAPAKSGHGAPCCIGAALLADTLSFPANPGNSPVFVLPGQLLPSVWLPGPERPPRASLI